MAFYKIFAFFFFLVKLNFVNEKNVQQQTQEKIRQKKEEPINKPSKTKTQTGSNFNWKYAMTS